VTLAGREAARAYLARFDVVRTDGAVRLGVLVATEGWAVLQLEPIQVNPGRPDDRDPLLHEACGAALQWIGSGSHVLFRDSALRDLVPATLAALPVDPALASSGGAILKVYLTDVAAVVGPEDIRPITTRPTTSAR
jgi:hypothetical protein